MSTNLTAREREVMMLAYQCFKTSVQVDYDKLAGLADLKTAASATTSYLSARKSMLAGKTLTARQREILSLSWRCSKGSPQVDYNKLKDKAKLANAASATTAFLAAKKKFLSSSTKQGDDDTATHPKKRKLSKTKAEKVPEYTSMEADSESEDAEKTNVVPEHTAAEAGGGCGNYETMEKRIKLEEDADDAVHPLLFETALEFENKNETKEAAQADAEKAEEEEFHR